MLNQRTGINVLLLLLIVLFSHYRNFSIVSALDCDISLEDIVEVAPLDWNNIISGLVVFDTQLHAYTSLEANVPLYTPLDIEDYYRSGATKLAPSGTFVFTPYTDTDKNLKLYFAELLSNSTSYLIIDNPMWHKDSFSSPYWLDSSATIVPVRLSATQYSFNVIQMPSGEQSEITVSIDDDMPPPRRIPVLSPDMTEVAYVSLNDSKEILVIVDIVQQTVLLEVEFPYIDNTFAKIEPS